MKLFIDVPTGLTDALYAVSVSGQSNTDHIKVIQEFYQKLTEKLQSISDPTIDEIYFSPGEEPKVSLGKQLIFDPHTAMDVQHPGMALSFPHRKMITHRFEIGKDHSGMLIMTQEAWGVLSETGHEITEQSTQNQPA